MMNDFNPSNVLGLSQLGCNKMVGGSSSASILENMDTSGMPHVYATARDPNSNDMKELERSVIVNIERAPESYICIHNVMKLMYSNSELKANSLKWKPYNDNKFLIEFESKGLRDRFLRGNDVFNCGEAVIKFKAFTLNDVGKRKEQKFKVWLTLKGLPAQHLCYKTAELVASRYGRLYACDLHKKETFVGSFRIMIDCNDITEIAPYMVFHFENDGETVIEVAKDYICSIETYNEMNFNEQEMVFEEVMIAMLEENKLTPLTY